MFSLHAPTKRRIVGGNKNTDRKDTTHMVICDCFAEEAEELLNSFNKIKFAKLYAVNLSPVTATQDNALFTLPYTLLGSSSSWGSK